MTAPATANDLAATAWQQYQTEEHRLRDEYIAAVRIARGEYATATAPARAAYDQAEHTAWQAYYHAGRWNYRTYQAKLGMDPDGPAPAAPVVTPPTADTGSTCGCQVPRPRPTFTPTPETEE